MQAVGRSLAILAALWAAGGASAQSPMCEGLGARGQPAALAADSVTSGRLEGEGARRAFRLRVPARSAIRIDMESDAFDSRLVLCEREGGQWRQVAENDDGGNGLNARLRVSAAATPRDVVVIATATSGRGPFRLVTQTLPPPRPPASLSVGETRAGSLAEGQSDAWDVRLERGRVYRIEMASDALDSVVEVRRASDPDGEPLASDDDGGDGRNARLVFVPPESGSYRLTAKSFGDGAGAYRLSVATVEVRPLGLGETRAELPPGGVSAWQFTAVPGTAYLIEMKSRDFDSFLEVAPVDGSGRTMRDDDGGDGTDARLLLMPAAPGPHLVVARALGNGQGRYTLSLTALVRKER